MARGSCIPVLFVIIIFAGLESSRGQTIPPKKFSVEASATVQESPPQIALSWPADPDATSYDIFRRTISDWQPMTTLGGGQNNWTDTAVSPGIRYEYKFIKHTAPG